MSRRRLRLVGCALAVQVLLLCTQVAWAIADGLTGAVVVVNAIASTLGVVITVVAFRLIYGEDDHG